MKRIATLIVIFQKPSLSELAPSLKGGCRGFKGPVPQPLWIRTYSIVERNLKGSQGNCQDFCPARTQSGASNAAFAAYGSLRITVLHARSWLGLSRYSIFAPFSIRRVRNSDR